MVKTTEGVIISSSEIGSSKHLPNYVAQHLPQVDADLNSLPRITRQLFAKDVQKAVGDIENASLPLSIFPVLQNLLAASQEYVQEGDEQFFMKYCLEAIEQCSHGWSYLSYWVSTEQSHCYSIYWGLKAALEKHQKQMTMYLGSKNDGLPKNDSDPPFSPDPKVASMKDWLANKRNKDVSEQDQSSISGALLKVLGGKAKCTQKSVIQQYACQGLKTLDHFAIVQQHITQITDNKEEKQEA
jgi:hypothetical protein